MVSLVARSDDIARRWHNLDLPRISNASRMRDVSDNATFQALRQSRFGIRDDGICDAHLVSVIVRCPSGAETTRRPGCGYNLPLSDLRPDK
jgi:hypothetical protein